MPETLYEAGSRLCRTQRKCETCPLDNLWPCVVTDKYADQFPQQSQIIRDWAAEHPPEEENSNAR